MRYIQEIGITNKSVSGDRGAYFLSRRAHLLTTDNVGGVLSAAVVRYTILCVGATRQYFYNRYTRKEVIAYRHIPS